MPVFYWPGSTLTAPTSLTWDSTPWDTMPGSPPGTPSFAVVPHSYDPNRPGVYNSPTPAIQLNGGLGTPFTIVGDGREWQFRCTANTPPLGVIMQLVQPGSSTVYTNTYGNSLGVPGWVAYSAAQPGTGYAAVAAFSAVLNAGETYNLWVATTGSLGQSDPPWVSGYGQVFTLSVAYAPPLNNDRRANALDVGIVADGLTYKTSPPILNYRLSNSDTSSGTDDVSNDYYKTAWWRYRPVAATDFTAVGYVEPLGYTGITLIAYRMSVLGVLSVIQTRGTPLPATVTGHASAGETIYFMMGFNVTASAYSDPTQTYELWVTGGKSINPNPDPTPPPPPVDPPPDTFEFPPLRSDVIAPAVPAKPATVKSPNGASGSSTLLDLVRDFSAAVNRAVRITGSTSIEMVDPAVPIPTGWADNDSAALYSAVTRSAKASTPVLSLNAGDVTLTASGALIADDVRLVTSNWRIPNRLPVPGLPAAPVQRVTYTFSPAGFRASVDFHYHSVPLAARRT